MKKILTLAILVGLAGMNVSPAIAIDDTNKNKTAKQSIFKRKSKPDSNQYKFDYVNYDWWKAFDDEYLSSYIEKAIDEIELRYTNYHSNLS